MGDWICDKTKNLPPPGTPARQLISKIHLAAWVGFNLDPRNAGLRASRNRPSQVPRRVPEPELDHDAETLTPQEWAAQVCARDKANREEFLAFFQRDRPGLSEEEGVVDRGSIIEM